MRVTANRTAVCGLVFWRTLRKGDHSPRHVHVYRRGRLVLKWDLDNKIAMKGKGTKRLLALIEQLEEEGLL